MRYRFPAGGVLLLSLLVAGCSSRAVVPAGHPLLGKWEYGQCLIKNTAVRGTVTFRADGTFLLDAVARDDYPVSPIRGTYRYSLQGNRLVTDYPHGYGLGQYWLVQGDGLYFAAMPITNAVSQWTAGQEVGNWQYRLQRK